MLLKFLFVQMLFLPLSCGSNITLENPPNISNKAGQRITDPVPSNNVMSTTKITIPAEGGTITQINTNLSIPKDNSTIYMELDKELGKPKNNSIVPRKGVNLDDFKDNISNSTKSSDLMSHDEMNVKKQNITLQTTNHTKISNDSRIDYSIHEKKPDVVNHKPAVLSYEALHGLSHDVLSAPRTSSKTITSDQIPNPNSGHVQSSAASQPGMIMPVVITILTVPLFAVLGYMALRRGQEAWKNRHYKRMDFLLDGMYND